MELRDFNTYGARRGNHEVMMRGTFANIRLRNLLAGGKEGGWTTHLDSGEVMSIYDAAMRYAEEKVPLIILAGREYGSGSSRDWAAKGPMLQGVRAVIAQSFERIHRSNLVGMGVLPLQFREGDFSRSRSASTAGSATPSRASPTRDPAPPSRSLPPDPMATPRSRRCAGSTAPPMWTISAPAASSPTCFVN